jgi:hypothetical protein
VLAKNFDLQHFLAQATTEVIVAVAKTLNVQAKNGVKITGWHDWQALHIAFFLTCFSPSQGPTGLAPAA